MSFTVDPTELARARTALADLAMPPPAVAETVGNVQAILLPALAGAVEAVVEKAADTFRDITDVLGAIGAGLEHAAQQYLCAEDRNTFDRQVAHG